MKNATLKVTRGSRPTLVQDAPAIGSTPRPEDAPHFVALEHRVTAACHLDSCKRNLNHVEWTASRIRIGVPSEASSGYGVELKLVIGSDDVQHPDIEYLIASDADGPISALTSTEFRRIVAALNAVAAQLPDIAEPAR